MPWIMPLAVAGALRVALVVFMPLGSGEFFFVDDRTYDAVGSSLATAWGRGSFPDPSSIGFAGSATYGYFVWVAALYHAFGHHWWIVRIASAVLSAVAVVPAASIGSQVGGFRLGRQAAWIVALYPSAVFWASTGLKDGPLVTLFLIAISLSFRPLSMKTLSIQLGLGTVAFSMRPGLGIVCLLAAASPIARAIRARRIQIRRHIGRRVLAVAALVAVAILSAANVPSLLMFLERSAIVEGTLSLPLGSMSSSSPNALASFATAVLGPFPWAFGEGTDSIYRALYPGMVMWIVLLPAGVLGLARTLRTGPSGARGAALASALYFVMYLAYFGSEGFYRQRLLVEVVLLILAAYSFAVRPETSLFVTSAWLVCLAPAIAVQSGIYPPWAAIVLAAGAMVSLAPMRMLVTRR